MQDSDNDSRISAGGGISDRGGISDHGGISDDEISDNGGISDDGGISDHGGISDDGGRDDDDNRIRAGVGGIGSVSDSESGEGASSGSNGENFSSARRGGSCSDEYTFDNMMGNSTANFSFEKLDTFLMEEESILEEMFKPLYPGAIITICAAYCAIMTYAIKINYHILLWKIC